MLNLLSSCNPFQGFLSFLNTLQDSHCFPDETQSVIFKKRMVLLVDSFYKSFIKIYIYFIIYIIIIYIYIINIYIIYLYVLYYNPIYKYTPFM